MNDFASFLKFIQLTHRFQQTKRSLDATGEERRENDAEHCYQLALLSWYIISHHKLDLNIEKVFQYALAHDLVEAYAGDTDAFDEKMVALKYKKEEEALVQLRSDFPDFTDLHEAIHNYELREDPESRFVYALDKILPMANTYFDHGKYWKAKGVTFERLMENKVPKVAKDKTIEELFNKLVEKLEEDKINLFPPNN